jgi:hypothetical protein
MARFFIFVMNGMEGGVIFVITNASGAAHLMTGISEAEAE